MSDSILFDLDPDGTSGSIITVTATTPWGELRVMVDVRAVREGYGLTQEEFALRFGLDLSTLRNWEQGRTRPDGPARVLLRVIERRPRAVEEALG